MNKLEKLFTNLDFLSECAADVELSEYRDIIRSERISSNDSSEQGAYFCAVPKSNFTCMGEVFPIFFIHDLYDSEEWEKNNSNYNGLDRNEWKNHLRNGWIPEYLAIGKNVFSVKYCTVEEMEFCNDLLPIAKELASSAIQSPVKRIVQYGLMEWHCSSYLIETEHEYIDFQYWATA